MVFYSDQRESPSSDRSLMNCDGKSVAHSGSAPRHGWHGCCQWARRIISTLLKGVPRQTLKATQRASKSSCFLACSSCFPVWLFAELLDEGCSFSDLVCMLCSALRGGTVRKNLKHTVSWDMGRWKHILAQGSTEASKTSCHDAKENRRTESCCWHTWRHADSSNNSCSTTQTANLFFQRPIHSRV